MPHYEYHCRQCGLELRVADNTLNKTWCPECRNGFLQRVWGFRMASVMHSHLNPSTGTVISDQRQFERELKRKSEEMTERTGIPHNYVPADPADTKALKVTEEGLASTYDRRKAEGTVEKPWRL